MAPKTAGAVLAAGDRARGDPGASADLPARATAIGETHPAEPTTTVVDHHASDLPATADAADQADGDDSAALPARAMIIEEILPIEPMTTAAAHRKPALPAIVDRAAHEDREDLVVPPDRATATGEILPGELATTVADRVASALRADRADLTAFAVRVVRDSRRSEALQDRNRPRRKILPRNQTRKILPRKKSSTTKRKAHAASDRLAQGNRRRNRLRNGRAPGVGRGLSAARGAAVLPEADRPGDNADLRSVRAGLPGRAEALPADGVVLRHPEADSAGARATPSAAGVDGDRPAIAALRSVVVVDRPLDVADSRAAADHRLDAVNLGAAGHRWHAVDSHGVVAGPHSGAVSSGAAGRRWHAVDSHAVVVVPLSVAVHSHAAETLGRAVAFPEVEDHKDLAATTFGAVRLG